MTAAALCEELSISSGDVSTAIKQLIPVGLVERVPAPGSRRDHYRFREGAWDTLGATPRTALGPHPGQSITVWCRAQGTLSLLGRHRVDDTFPRRVER
ncbi:hypothetical protein SUDANB51_04117 [Streptomyces sp. enrichment culture]